MCLIQTSYKDFNGSTIILIYQFANFQQLTSSHLVKIPFLQKEPIQFVLEILITTSF